MTLGPGVESNLQAFIGSAKQTLRVLGHIESQQSRPLTERFEHSALAAQYRSAYSSAINTALRQVQGEEPEL